MPVFVFSTHYSDLRKEPVVPHVLPSLCSIRHKFRKRREQARSKKMFIMILKKIRLAVITLCTFAMPAMATQAPDKDNVDEIDNYDFLYNNDGSVDNYDVASMENLMDEAFSLIGTRYRSGASGEGAFDCSGFTSYLYKQMGIQLNRSSSGQYTQGEAVASDNLQTGDLVFFSSPRSGRGVGHVGIVVDYDPMNGSFSFIHASIKGVKVSQSDEPYYSRRYIGARRITQQ